MSDQVTSPGPSTGREDWPRRQARPPVERALRWIREHRIPGDGIRVHTKSSTASQEVTGYLIPTLYAWGQRELARDLAAWEARVQRPDGAFSAPSGQPYTFDTAQVIRGFLAVLDEMPQVERSLRRACDFVVRQIAPDGEVRTPSDTAWRSRDGEVFSSYTNLYVLPPLVAAGSRLGEPTYAEAALRSLKSYTSRPDLVEFKASFGTLSHIFGYMLEALVDLGEVDLARQGLRQAAAIQGPDGAVPAYPGAAWICTPGVAQLALAWYKVGEHERARRALAYLETKQHDSGGWFGSYGPGARYFPDAEISWVPKFFLDGCALLGQLT